MPIGKAVPLWFNSEELRPAWQINCLVARQFKHPFPYLHHGRSAIRRGFTSRALSNLPKIHHIGC